MSQSLHIAFKSFDGPEVIDLQFQLDLQWNLYIEWDIKGLREMCPSYVATRSVTLDFHHSISMYAGCIAAVHKGNDCTLVETMSM